MKRIGNIYERIISMDNLRLADDKARKGKLRTYGVRVHDQNREENLLKLHESLKSRTFKNSEYTMFVIHEPKEREIYRLPYYPDRILHHAIMNVVEPIWLSVFPHNTYSCIKGRGIEGCARAVEKIIKKYKGKPLYCLKIDIKKYYPSVDNAIMMKIVERKIKDKDFLWLVNEIVMSMKGLPIGNYLSQFLSNLYLAYFMHYVNERLHIDVGKEKPFDSTAYADDILLFSDKKEDLHKALAIIKDYFKVKLKIEVKSNWQIFPIAMNRSDRHGRALDYVGYKFFREQKLIRKSIKKNFCRKVSRLNRKAEIELAEYKQAIAQWLGWAKHSNSRHLLKTIIKKEHYESIL